jgi:hypothetical protein
MVLRLTAHSAILLSPWLLIPFFYIAMAGWAGAEQMDPEHPIRGFLIAALSVWLLCFYGYHGMTLSEDNDDQDDQPSYAEQQEEAHSGRYFGQFLIYVGFAYGAMLIKLERDRRGR